MLRFAPAVAVPRPGGDLASEPGVTELEDGSLEWRATVAGTVEIRLWILAWGDDVEVLKPAALRAEVAATHARAAARYAKA